CPIIELKPDAPQTGSLAGASSCHSVDSLQDVYTFTMPSSGAVEIALASDDFFGSLLLRDGKDNLLSRSDATGAADARISAYYLPAGVYSLSVASIVPGEYSVNYKLTPFVLDPCPGPQRLVPNSGSTGMLGPGGCPGPDGQAMQTYEFSIPSPGSAA